MSKYLKHFLLLLSFLVIPMNLASQAMEDEHDHSPLRHRVVQANFEEPREDSVVTHLTSSPTTAKEEEPTSWTSYLTSPAKTVIKNTCKIIDFAPQSLQEALIIGFYFFHQVIAVVQYCECICINHNTGKTYPAGGYANQTVCERECTSLGMNFDYCRQK